MDDPGLARIERTTIYFGLDSFRATCAIWRRQAGDFLEELQDAFERLRYEINALCAMLSEIDYSGLRQEEPKRRERLTSKYSVRQLLYADVCRSQQRRCRIALDLLVRRRPKRFKSYCRTWRRSKGTNRKRGASKKTVVM